MASEGERLAVLEERVSAMARELSEVRATTRVHGRRLGSVERAQANEDAVAEQIARATAEHGRREARRDRLLLGLGALALTGLNIAVTMWG